MIGVLHFNLWHIFKQKTIYKDLKDRFDTLETSSGTLKGYKLTHYTLFAYLIQNQRVKPVSCGSVDCVMEYFLALIIDTILPFIWNATC